MKRCTACRVEKDRSDFHRRAASSDGLKPICKRCAIAKQSDRYKADPAKHLEYSRAWYRANARRVARNSSTYRAANADQIAEQRKKYRQKNAAAVRESQKRSEIKNRKKGIERRRRHHRSNRHKIVQRVRLWRLANPDSYAEQRVRRRARKLGSVVAKVDWRSIVTLYNGHCAYCLMPFGRLTKDHMVPLSQGGAHDQSNIVPACALCNSIKGAKNVLHFLMSGSWPLHSTSRPMFSGSTKP